MFALMWVMLIGSVVAAVKEAPPVWMNAIDTNAMERVLFDYTNNVIRSEWAGRNKSIGRELPANLGFQFAAVGECECVLVRGNRWVKKFDN